MRIGWDGFVSREHVAKSANTRENAMLSYVMIGANDIQRSERFYSAILCPLGYERTEEPNVVIYSLADRYNGLGAIYVRKPYDGRDATVGNGSMLAFRAATQKLVRDLHAAGQEAGGSDEGTPGFRDEYSERFYVGYLRDDVGNKVAIFSNNPDEPSRGK
jgi:catechol 2,3-dioxygenase-like lactoylglutathione lyase family enzyme